MIVQLTSHRTSSRHRMHMKHGNSNILLVCWSLKCDVLGRKVFMGVFESYGLDEETKCLTISKKMFEKLRESTSLFSKLTGNILETIWKHQYQSQKLQSLIILVYKIILISCEVLWV